MTYILTLFLTFSMLLVFGLTVSNAVEGADENDHSTATGNKSY